MSNTAFRFSFSASKQMSLERVFLIICLGERVVLTICLGVGRQPCKGKVYWILGGSSFYKLSPVLQSCCFCTHWLVFGFLLVFFFLKAACRAEFGCE